MSIRLDALADQWQQAEIGAAMAQGKSRPISDGRFFHARQGPVAAKNLAQQHRFLRGGPVNIRVGIVGSGSQV